MVCGIHKMCKQLTWLDVFRVAQLNGSTCSVLCKHLLVSHLSQISRSFSMGLSWNPDNIVEKYREKKRQVRKKIIPLHYTYPYSLTVCVCHTSGKLIIVKKVDIGPAREVFTGAYPFSLCSVEVNLIKNRLCVTTDYRDCCST